MSKQLIFFSNSILKNHLKIGLFFCNYLKTLFLPHKVIWHRRQRRVVSEAVGAGGEESLYILETLFHFQSLLFRSISTLEMTTDMGPPPPRNTSSSSPMDSDAGALEEDSTVSSTATMAPMGPPPPKSPTPSDSDPPALTSTQKNESPVNSMNSDASEHSENVSDGSASDKAVELASKQPQSVSVPYTIPSWSGAPSHRFYLEVLKDGCIIDQLNV